MGSYPVFKDFFKGYKSSLYLVEGKLRMIKVLPPPEAGGVGAGPGVPRF